MLLRSQIQELAKTFTKNNVGHAEKLYLQDILLHSIYREVVGELVFKGGTALNKLYNLDRFSEDLDFTAAGEIDLANLLEAAERYLKNFGAEVDKVQSKENERSFSARLGIQGPLYTGNELSLSTIRIEVNKIARAENPIIKRYTPNFPDVPTFEILVLTEEEILAEKIRGIMTRNQARDLYDIYHLLHKGIKIDGKLVEKKLRYYDLEYSPAALLDRAMKTRDNWEDLGNLTYSRLPDFQQALDILSASIASDEEE